MMIDIGFAGWPQCSNFLWALVQNGRRADRGNKGVSHRRTVISFEKNPQPVDLRGLVALACPSFIGLPRELFRK